MAGPGGEELDYTLHFPPPSGQIEPVIVLLGWAGCQEKHLAKYNEIYANRCITLRYTAPTKDIFYKYANLHSSAKKIVEVLIDLNLEDNPILFHVFSNGGGMIYFHISQLAKTPQFSKLNIVGAIFDSLPTRRGLVSGSRALLSTLHGNFFMLHYLAVTLFVVQAAIRTLFRGIWAFWKQSEDSEDFFSYMYNEKSNWPSLYLYSKTDEITDYHYVKQVIEHRKKLGMNVSEICWENSAHVQHMRKHKEAYVKGCLGFLEDCIKH